jgi:hypothetical protein
MYGNYLTPGPSPAKPERELRSNICFFSSLALRIKKHFNFRNTFLLYGCLKKLRRLLYISPLQLVGEGPGVRS